MPVPERHATCGLFWWLSVFGRRVRREVDGGEGWEFPWVNTLPSRVLGCPADRWPGVASWNSWWQSFDFPTFQLPDRGSPEHWLLVAWCADPHAPRPAPRETLALDDAEKGQRVEDGRSVGDPAVEYAVSRFVNFDPVAPFQLQSAQASRLQRAVEAIGEGLRAGADPGILLPLRAAALFHLRDFDRAGTDYRGLAREKLSFRTVDPLGNPGTRGYGWEFSFMAAMCYRRAGDYLAAEGAFVSALEAERAFEAGFHWWFARLLCEQARYLDAAASLRRSLDSPLGPEEGWEISSLLAVAGALADAAEAKLTMESLRATHPDLVRSFERLNASLFPFFKDLSRRGSEEWLRATIEVLGRPGFEALRDSTDRAILLHLSGAVELELRERVFVRYRATNPPSTAFPAEASNFQRFLHGSDVLTLGDMCHALVSPGGSHLVEFRKWAAGQFGADAWPRNAMWRLRDLRNAVGHVAGTAAIPRAFGDASLVFERLFRSSGAKQGASQGRIDAALRSESLRE